MPETTALPDTLGLVGADGPPRLDLTQPPLSRPDPTRHRDLAIDRPEPPGGLPRPPSDRERDLYLGPRWRWVTPVSFLGYVLIVLSIGLFVARHPWAVALLAPLTVSGIGTTVSLFSSSRRRRDSLSSHRRRVAAWRPARIPKVDVFLPSAGEDLALLHNTYRHVSQLRWGGQLTVHVLDDSGRGAVRYLAESFGFRYRSRPDRGWFKKAGNLRYGFEHSDGDLILVLDADFVPRPDALHELAPYLDDPAVAIVQSPQFFDIDPRMNWLQRAAGATQVLFYRWVQPSRDRSNAAICVGTSALYRRSALEHSGGFALIGHSEDVHTGVNLMKAGFRVRYVPVIVTKGLCPDSLDQFSTQQYRWCSGSMSLLFSRSFHRMPLTLMQRLSYWSGFLYYITTALNVFVIPLPAILMVFFAPDQVRPANYVFVALAMVSRQTIVPFITLDRESLPGLARIQTSYSFSHAVALFDAVRGRSDGWVATGTRQRSRTAVRVRALTITWCVAVQVMLWVGIVWRIPQYGLQEYWVTVAAALLNLYVAYPLILGRSDVPTLPDLWNRARARLGRVRPASAAVPAAVLSAVVRPAVVPAPAARPRRRFSASLWPWLTAVLTVQALLALRPGLSRNAFEDEGLYVYMGHRVLEHVLHGSELHEVPGAYFSGAPYLYPVLAAAGDHVGGLAGARAVSLLFAMLATIGVAGLTARLYGRRAAVLAAAAFALSGPVIYVSHLAVYDSMMMAVVAFAAWVAVRDMQRNGFRWAIGAAALLTLAGFVKYAGLVYAPMVALLAVAVGWPRLRWLAVRRAVFVLFATATIFFFIVVWDGDLVAGIRSTTLERAVIVPAARPDLLLQIVKWVGPWLLLAGLAAVLRRRQWFVSGTLLLASVVAPLQQLRIGEQVSLSKHCAFGLVFAAPLIGSMLAALFARAGRKAALPVGLVLLILVEFGLSSSKLFLTGWVDDRDLVPVLTAAVQRHPGASILGERPSPQRYQLRKVTNSRQWNDTYYLAYGGEVGRPAYAKALYERHFGVVFLDVSTEYGAYVHEYLISHPGRYRISAKAPRWFRGKRAGDWLIYEPTWPRPSERSPLGRPDRPT